MLDYQQLKSALIRMLRLEEGGDDDDIANLALSASISTIEGHLGYQTSYGSYTETHEPRGSVVYLNYAPVHSVKKITSGTATIEHSEYKVLSMKGIIIFASLAKPVTIEYVGGYESYPPDLAYAIVYLAMTMFRMKDFAGVSSEKLGDYSVSYNVDVPAHVHQVLLKYRRV